MLRINRNPQLQLPISFKDNSVINNAVGLFVGYLVFDTWIGNTDRHHENWAWILHDNQKDIFLAPTFDHAASLGRELLDSNRIRFLNEEKEILLYAKRAKTPFYGHSSQSTPLKTFEVTENISIGFPEPVKYWIDRILNIEEQQIDRIFTNMPREFISQTEIDFAKRLLLLNQERLEDIYWKIE